MCNPFDIVVYTRLLELKVVDMHKNMKKHTIHSISMIIHVQKTKIMKKLTKKNPITIIRGSSKNTILDHLRVYENTKRYRSAIRWTENN